MNLYAASTASADAPATSGVSRTYAWVVFSLTFCLMLSDYMSRQALNAVFPILKTQWQISDTHLGALSSVVPLTVGLLTFPISFMADRWGRVRSIALMAALWSLATLACAVATNYGELFAARFFVGVGEAAYGSVGLAVVLSVFPRHLRASLTGAFTSGAAFGTVLGVSLAGQIATRLGWRWSIGVMAIVGLALLALFCLVVTEKRLAAAHPDTAAENLAFEQPKATLRGLFLGLFPSPSAVCAYAGCGLQLLIQSTLFVWLPSYLNRYFGMPLGKAALIAAGLILVSGVGQVMCGVLTDRFSRSSTTRRWNMAIIYCIVLCAVLMIAFRLPPGNLQLGMIALGVFFAASSLATSGAIIADSTPPAIHGSAFAALTLANNILGLAPGPVLTGMLADAIGLKAALQWVPLTMLLPLTVCFIGKRAYVNGKRGGMKRRD